MDAFNIVQKQTRDTRKNNELTFPRYRLATGQKTFTYGGAKLYISIALRYETREILTFLKREFSNIFFNS